MPEPPQLTPPIAEEQRYYAEPLMDDQASHPSHRCCNLLRKRTDLSYYMFWQICFVLFLKRANICGTFMAGLISLFIDCWDHLKSVVNKNRIISWTGRDFKKKYSDIWRERKIWERIDRPLNLNMYTMNEIFLWGCPLLLTQQQKRWVTTRTFNCFTILCPFVFVEVQQSGSKSS